MIRSPIDDQKPIVWSKDSYLTVNHVGSALAWDVQPELVDANRSCAYRIDSKHDEQPYEQADAGRHLSNRNNVSKSVKSSHQNAQFTAQKNTIGSIHEFLWGVSRRI